MKSVSYILKSWNHSLQLATEGHRARYGRGDVGGIRARLDEQRSSAWDGWDLFKSFDRSYIDRPLLGAPDTSSVLIINYSPHVQTAKQPTSGTEQCPLMSLKTKPTIFLQSSCFRQSNPGRS